MRNPEAGSAPSRTSSTTPTTEQAVVPGRETYGEPKKIAQIDFQKEGDRVRFATDQYGKIGIDGFLVTR